MFTTYLVLGFIGVIVSCVFGTITKNINESKGYCGGFAWGFWLGVIGIIVVSCKQPNNYTYQRESIIRNPAPPVSVNEVPPPGGWKCICGRGNAAYVSSCACGRSKSEVLQGAKKEISSITDNISAKKERSSTADSISAKKENSSITDNISTIREYKKLLDDGIISQEEFEAKKKQLLDL